MLRAEQIALEQQANQQLLLIREKELNYFVTNYNSFGTQAALLAGFSLTALTSLNGFTSIGGSWAKIILFVSACVCLTASLHCMLNTMFIGVWGPGLALRGPAGSMVRAVDGMIREKRQIFTSFGIAILSFQFMGIATTWIVMETPLAVVCSVVFIMGYFMIYKYTLRVFNRFRLNVEGTDWLGNSTEHFTSNPLARPSANDGSAVKDENSTRFDSAEKPSSIVRFFKKSKPTMMSTMTTSLTADHVYMEGYLTKKGIASGILVPDPWTRRYFVLQGKYLYYYKTKEDYHAKAKAIKNRPIDLSTYGVEASSGANPPYIFRLRPVSHDDERRTWDFRCDTDEEFEQWVSALEVFCPRLGSEDAEA